MSAGKCHHLALMSMLALNPLRFNLLPDAPLCHHHCFKIVTASACMLLCTLLCLSRFRKTSCTGWHNASAPTSHPFQSHMVGSCSFCRLLSTSQVQVPRAPTCNIPHAHSARTVARCTAGGAASHLRPSARLRPASVSRWRASWGCHLRVPRPPATTCRCPCRGTC